MTDPITTAVATALATKAVAGLTEADKAAFNALARLVRRKLANTQSSGILHHAETDPASDARRQVLAEALAQAMAKDRHFSEQIADLWRQIQDGRTGTSHGSVLNVVAGDANGNLVQARDIHGDVSFG
jgi:hypothetical protein